jgi:hypothetical protein
MRGLADFNKSYTAAAPDQKGLFSAHVNANLAQLGVLVLGLDKAWAEG